MPVAAWNLEAATADGDGAVTSALGSRDRPGKGQSQRGAVRGRAQHARPCEEALQGRLAGVIVYAGVVLEFDPRLGGLVEQFESKALDALEHGQQAPLDGRPGILG